MSEREQTAPIQDFQMITRYYAQLGDRMERVRATAGRPLTLAEKILYAHASGSVQPSGGYGFFRPDRVAMQDATAQMALLQLQVSGVDRAAVPASIHCDHLVRACEGAAADLGRALTENDEVYRFLRSSARHYGMGFWAAGRGIIHQTVLENYAFPGGMMIGTDSHTPNAGGLSMVAIGVGGADGADVLTGQPWELPLPRITAVRLTGRLGPWASAKDVILHLLGLISTRGATGEVLEYIGPGVATLSAAGRATICNMGAETGATCSLFPYDGQTAAYLRHTGREAVARLADGVATHLRADDEALAHPEQYYHRVIEIDLGGVSPHLNGPFTPDAATPIEQMAEKARAMDYPLQVEVGLIGSCTNSAYEDLARAAAVARAATAAGLTARARLIVCPGSEAVSEAARRDGLLADLERMGATVMASACGPCIGQWDRYKREEERGKRNTIVTSFNRNFRSRADGNPETYAFVASPEMVMAMAVSGRLDFDPRHDPLTTPTGEAVTLPVPEGRQFADGPWTARVTPPGEDGCGSGIEIPGHSERLQRLTRFEPWDGSDPEDMPVLIRVAGKCTTDHISPAGKWLRYRGHLENISRNLLLGATNAATGKAGEVENAITHQMMTPAEAAADYKRRGLYSVIIADQNYGEGSSREHAAMEPRFLGVRAVVARSFARIHETNLKKQGVLALTFARAADYDRVRTNDRISISGLATMRPGQPLTLTLAHSDGTRETIAANHSYNEQQIGWFRAGAAINEIGVRSEN